MKRGVVIAGIGLGVLVLSASYVRNFLTTPHIVARAAVLPAGDTMDLQAVHQLRRSDLFGNTQRRTQDDYPGPLARLFKWSVASKDSGAATVNAHGLLKGARPGAVVVRVALFGRTGEQEITILPRLAELSVQPARLELRVGEMTRLVLRARLADGARFSDWLPATLFLIPQVPGERVDGSQYVDAPAGGYYSRQNDEWWFEIRGKAPGHTTIYLRMGAREVAVPVSVQAQPVAADLHPDSLAHALSAAPGYDWKTREFEGVRVHVLRGTHADTAAETLLRLIKAARSKAISWSVNQDSGPLELFFVDTRVQLQKRAGTRSSKQRPGERTLLSLYNQDYTPFLAQELAELYATSNWGPPRSGRWLSAGFGTLIGRYCREHLADAFLSQLDAGRMRGWPELVRDFESIDELDAKLQAASMVDWLQRRFDLKARDLWYIADLPALERETGSTVAQMDAEWRENVRNAYSAIPFYRDKFFDQINRQGCSELD